VWGQVNDPDKSGGSQWMFKAFHSRWDYLSHSQITLFQACTLKWHFTYVEQAAPETVSAALLLGSSIHVVIQHHLQCQLAAEKPPTIDQLMELFHKTWTDEAKDTPVDYSGEEDAGSQAELARRMLDSFLASPYGAAEGQTLGIEETLRIPLHPELPELVTRVDHIAIANDALLVTDFKTTRSMWNLGTAEEHAEQLHLYAEAVKAIAENFNIPVNIRFVVITKAKTPKVNVFEIETDSLRVKRSTLVFQNVFKAMQTGVVYPSPSKMNCSGCPFKQRCKSWAGGG
jgi:putative RecB family exonuclease